MLPTITGRAWVTGTAQYLLDPDDPFPPGGKRMPTPHPYYYHKTKTPENKVSIKVTQSANPRHQGAGLGRDQSARSRPRPDPAAADVKERPLQRAFATVGFAVRTVPHAAAMTDQPTALPFYDPDAIRSALTPADAAAAVRAALAAGLDPAAGQP